MAMATAVAIARGPSLTRAPHFSRPQSFHNVKSPKPLFLQTRRFTTSAAAKSEHVVSAPLVDPATAMGAAFMASLSSCDSAFAAQQVMDLAANDNRGTLLLLILAPAIGWVIYNILQPALNQINRMRNVKGLVACVGLGAGGAALFSGPGEARADEVLSLAAEAAGSDNRGLLLLLVISPALVWVLYNILQPALNQINKMRSG